MNLQSYASEWVTVNALGIKKIELGVAHFKIE